MLVLKKYINLMKSFENLKRLFRKQKHWTYVLLLLADLLILAFASVPKPFFESPLVSISVVLFPKMKNKMRDEFIFNLRIPVFVHW